MNVRLYKIVALSTGAVFLYLVALVFRLPQLFFMCAVFFLLPLLSHGLARASLRRLQCLREIPERMVEGGRGEICWRLTNPGWLPKFMLRVRDSLPPWLETEEGCRAEWWIPVLLGRETLEYRYGITAALRGRHRFGPVVVQAVDLFDLFTAQTTVGEPQELVVYPATVPVREEPYRGERHQGQRFSPRAAVLSEGVDFYSIREYQPGDDLRRIHWKTTARLNRFSVMEFEQNFSTNLLLLLDAQRGLHVGVGPQSTFEYGVKLAASLARHELGRGNAVGLLARGDCSIHLPVASGEAQWTQMMEALAVIQPEGNTPLAELIAEIPAQGLREATAVLISPNTDLQVVPAVAGLRARHIQVVFIVLEASSFHPSSGSLDGESLAALAAAGARIYVIRRGMEVGFPEEISDVQPLQARSVA
jgi:uncharacterized protein (DUF58 family)